MEDCREAMDFAEDEWVEPERMMTWREWMDLFGQERWNIEDWY